MSAIAIVLVLFSAFFHALKSYYTKQSIDKQVFLLLYTSCGLIVYFPLFLYFALREPLPLQSIALWCTLTAIIHVLYNICFTRAFELGELSLVYPIMRASPALTLLLAMLLLGETVSLRGLSGILLVVCGVYTINLRSLKIHTLLKPLRLLFSDRAQQFALLTMLSVAAYSIVDKIGANSMHPVLFSYLLSASTTLLYAIYLLPQKGPELLQIEWRNNKRQVISNAIISPGGYLLILIAFTMEKVSYVVGLRQLSIVFAVLMGSHLLGEEARLIRLCSALIIFVGSYLIATA